jgi:hypothetical protein
MTLMGTPSWCGQVELDTVSADEVTGSYNAIMGEDEYNQFPLAGFFSARPCTP